MANEKSPLHPSALRLRDLHVGRRIIIVNIYGYPHGEFEVIAEPFVISRTYFESTTPKHKLKVLLRSTDGRAQERFLSDMGVIPDGPRWNNANYTIDVRKKHLIEPAIPDPRPHDDDFFDDRYRQDYAYA